MNQPHGFAGLGLQRAFVLNVAAGLQPVRLGVLFSGGNATRQRLMGSHITAGPNVMTLVV